MQSSLATWHTTDGQMVQGERVRRGCLAVLMALAGLAVAPVAQATNYAWTNTGVNASDYWTTSANWTPGGIPGSATGDAAYLTNAVGNTYTSILNTTPANLLTALMLSNRLGTASLVVTQGIAATTCTVTTLTIANGGNLEIDAGCVVSNTTPIVWSGTNGVVRLNGGTLITLSPATLDFGVSGTTALVTSASAAGQGGVWRYGNTNYLSVGTAASSVSLTINNILLTNIAAYGISVGYNNANASNNSLLITNGAKAVVGGTLAIARNGGTNNSIVIAGANSGVPSVLDGNGKIFAIGLGQAAGCAATGNWMRVDNGGVLTNVATLGIGGVNSSALPGDFGNYLIVTNGGKAFCSATYVGSGIGACSNAIIIADNGVMNMNNVLCIGDTAFIGQTGNVVRVDQGGVLNTSGIIIIGGAGTNSYGNALNIVNGGKLFQSTASSITLGNFLGAVSNTVNVANGGQLFCGPVYVGYATASSNSSLTIVGGATTSFVSCTALTIGSMTSCYNTASVLAGGTCSLTNNNIIVGSGIGASSNSLVINGGQVVAVGTATAGSGTSGLFGNTIQVINGGLLEANNLQVNAGATGPVGGNTITNADGIYQFATVSPAITLLSNGMVYVNSGTISFRGVTNADVFCNQGLKPLDSTNKMAWSGNNAFRLNTATNTTTASQTYVFDPSMNATNFTRLEMVNGATRYRGQAGNTLTIGTAIGTGGQMLCSNTTALVDLAFTNNGTLTLVNSTLTLANNTVLNGTVAIDPLSKVQAGNLTLGPASILVLPPGTIGTNLTLMAYSGTLGGTFGSVSNLPSGYTINFGKGSNSAVQLAKRYGSAILFR